jgi:uncharacterized membrane protein YqaE (UPF0057 family)
MIGSFRRIRIARNQCVIEFAGKVGLALVPKADPLRHPVTTSPAGCRLTALLPFTQLQSNLFPPYQLDSRFSNFPNSITGIPQPNDRPTSKQATNYLSPAIRSTTFSTKKDIPSARPERQNNTMCTSDIFLGLIAIIFPPLPVWVKSGICSADSLINICLCVLGFIPGLLHAWCTSPLPPKYPTN